MAMRGWGVACVVVFMTFEADRSSDVCLLLFLPPSMSQASTGMDGVPSDLSSGLDDGSVGGRGSVA